MDKLIKSFKTTMKTPKDISYGTSNIAIISSDSGDDFAAVPLLQIGFRTRSEITLTLSHAKTAKGYMLEDVKVIS